MSDVTRTQEEIVAKIEATKENDPLGFATTDLITYLDFEHAKPYLVADATEDDWEYSPCTEEYIKAKMIDYLSFAWDKANNFRGISAYRSMEHYKAWFWLLNVKHNINFNDYEYYGKPQLVDICNFLGVDPDQYDNGVRLNSEPY